MKIAVAPHIPIIANGVDGNLEFENLSLFDLPTGVTIYVPENWYDFYPIVRGYMTTMNFPRGYWSCLCNRLFRLRRLNMSN